MVSSQMLVKAFLKASYDEARATRILSSIIGKDHRFEYMKGAGWTIIGKEKAKSVSLYDRTFVIYAANILKTEKWKGRICEASFIKIVHRKEEAAWHVGQASPFSPIRPGIKIKQARQILLFLEEAIIVFFQPLAIFRQLQMEIRNKTGTPLFHEFLSLPRLMTNLFGLKRTVTLAEAAQFLGLSIVHGDSAEIKAKGTAELFLTLLDLLHEMGIRTFHELQALERKRGEKVDFSGFDFDESFLSTLPSTPGVYQFLDDRDQPIYIGKAKNLKRRVSSYFLAFNKKPPKIRLIHDSIKKIEYEETGSELEALLKEYALIQSWHPPLNKQLAVHERATIYGRKRDLLIILPGSSEKEALLYIIKKGQFIKRMRIDPRRSPFSSIKNILQSIYFNEKKKSHPLKGKRKESSEVQMELIYSYLKENRDKVPCFDPTDYRNPEEVIKIIKSYLKILRHEGGLNTLFSKNDNP